MVSYRFTTCVSGSYHKNGVITGDGADDITTVASVDRRRDDMS